MAYTSAHLRAPGRLLFVLIALLTAQAAHSQVSTLEDDAGKLLNQWYRVGTAAGNHGDYYDNRDRGHSRLDLARFPQLHAVNYLQSEIEQLRDRGLQRVLLPFPVVGNSSMASPPTAAGSLPRIYYATPHGLEFLHTQYRGNNLYIYPEHRDHDPPPGFGDLYPTNTPYLVISQGSSGSDRPFVRVFFETMAAFQPTVKSTLIRTGLLMPTLQAIFRESNRMVRTREQYLSGVAHPSAFEGSAIDTLEMLRRAHEMTPDSIPPLVQLTVVSEDHPVAGVDFFEPSDRHVSETLADTPCVIGRIVRGPQYKKQITVSAEPSFDINRRRLNFHWVVLRGDSKRIRIETMGEWKQIAHITVPYHRRRPVAGNPGLMSNRVDIGVFAESAGELSAPCFVTFYTLPNEQRVYDKKGRLLEIAYQSPKGNHYTDPRLTAAKHWRDVYRYDKSGELTGWRRQVNGEWIDFTADGKRVLTRDASGKPTGIAPVRYMVNETNGLLEMKTMTSSAKGASTIGFAHGR